MNGAPLMNEQIKSISAVKPKRASGYQQRKKQRRGGHNVLWKRLTGSFDDAVKKFAANPAIAAPLTRLVFFEHLTVTQGMAGRRYADVVRKYERFHMDAGSRTARSANLQPARNSEDQTLERIINRGMVREYEAAAKVAKREYKRLMKVIDKYRDPVSGRNYAKDALDNLCLLDIEPASADRPQIAAVLTMVAREFGVGEKR
jgi:hypothetical protein